MTTFSFRLNEAFVDEYRNVEPDWGYVDVAGTSLSELIFLDKYSRVKEDGTKETWVDACERVINGMFTIQKDHCKDNRLPWNDNKAHRSAEKAFDLMFNFKWLPPGRGLWMMGSPLVMEQRNSAALQNCAFVSTTSMTKRDPSKPFTWLMEASMYGVGVGFDGRGATEEYEIYGPRLEDRWEYEIPDTKEGWVESVRLLLDSYLKPNQPWVDFDYSLIRPKGAPIKTFGGVAAGPDPLITLHAQIRDLFEGRAGETLTLVDIADIGNMIGVCVISGNVRRSAEIFLGPIDSDDFLNLKNAEEFPERNADNTGWGFMSNNSVQVNVGEDLSGIAEGIRRNGEPGVMWLDSCRDYGRFADPKNGRDYRVTGINPCFAPDTIIETVDGPMRIADITKPTRVYTRGHDGRLTVRRATASWVSKKDAETVKINLRNGDSLIVTPDHEVMLRGGEWIEAKNLKPNDSLEVLIRNRRGWRYSGVRLNSQPVSETVMEHRLQWESVIGPIPPGYDIDHINRDHHDNRLENLRLIRHDDHARLSRSQVPNDHQVHGPDGSFAPSGKNGRKEIEDAIMPPRRTNWVNQHTVVSVEPGPITDVYDLTVEDTHNMIANGVVASNCGEQPLESFEMCTLVEVYLDRCEDYAEYAEALKAAYLYAKTVTLIPTHWEETNAIMQRNRRIGTSVSGVANFLDRNGMHVLRKWLDDGYNLIQHRDRVYSDWLCVRESIKTTTVKPSGTTSLLTGSSPGVHWSPGGHYSIRRMTFDRDSDLAQRLIDAGYNWEQSVYTPGSIVVEFVIESRASRSERDVSLWEKAMLAAELQRWWSDNAVSVTLSYDPETEGGQIESILNWAPGNLKTVSFLPLGEVYKQAPWQAVDDAYMASYEAYKPSKVDLSTEYVGDVQEATGEAYCTTDTCLLPGQ